MDYYKPPLTPLTSPVSHHRGVCACVCIGGCAGQLYSCDRMRLVDQWPNEHCISLGQWSEAWPWVCSLEKMWFHLKNEHILLKYWYVGINVEDKEQRVEVGMWFFFIFEHVLILKRCNAAAEITYHLKVFGLCDIIIVPSNINHELDRLYLQIITAV